MNKTIMAIGIIALISLISVSAIKEIDYNARCDIIQKATKYRPETTWHNIGIYGRLNNGQITCFIPHKHTTTTKCTNKEVITTNCENVTTCEEPVCDWQWSKEKVCEWKHEGCKWKYKCEWKWHKEWVCQEPKCNTKTICTDTRNTIKVCK